MNGENMDGGFVAEGATAGNLVVDLDGVLYLGDEGVAGAGEAMRVLEERGYRIVLATNNATRTPEAAAAKVERLTGYRPRRIVTSAQSAARLLAADRPPALVVGGEGITEALKREGVPITTEWPQAKAVVVGLDRALSYERLAGAVLAVRSGARFVATNTDVTFPTPEGLVPGAGAIVAAIATAAEIEAEVAGKPHRPMRRLVGAELTDAPTWVIGDRPETDLAMGTAEGWRRVLVLGGVTARPEDAGEPYDDVVASAAELPALLP